MAKYTWTGLGGAEENVAASRLINQVAAYLPGVSAYDLQTALTAALSEALVPYGLATSQESFLITGIDTSIANVFVSTLTGNATVAAPLNPTRGQRITLTFIQDGTGGRTVGWHTVFKQSWADTGNTLNKRSSISFTYDGTNWNQDGAQTPYV